MNKEERDSWLLTLKVGDEVAYSSGGIYSAIRVAKIKSITKSRRFNLSDGATINNDGSIRGNNYFYIKPVTEEIKTRIWRNITINKIKHNLKIEKLSNENLNFLLKMLNDINS